MLLALSFNLAYIRDIPVMAIKNSGKTNTAMPSYLLSNAENVISVKLSIVLALLDHTHTDTHETMRPCVLALRSPAPQPSCGSRPRRLCSGSPVSSVSCPRPPAAGDDTVMPPAAPQPVWNTKTPNSRPTSISKNLSSQTLSEWFREVGYFLLHAHSAAVKRHFFSQK